MKILNHGNQDLLLELLLYFEKGVDRYVTHRDIEISNYTLDEIEQHLIYLYDADYLQGEYIPAGILSKFIFGGLTIYGRMLLKQLRTEQLI